MSNLNDFVIQDGILTKYTGSGGNVIIPDGITGIGNAGFLHCGSLTGVVIPDSVTVIGNGAFMGCGSLTDVVIPDSLKTIGKGAFYFSSLSLLTVPDGFKTIKNSAAPEGMRLKNIQPPSVFP